MTATATIWDNLYNANALDVATVVKLTRTLAIIPIVFFLSVYKQQNQIKIGLTAEKPTFNLFKLVPKFLILFLIAALLATVMTLPTSFVHNTKLLSKFFITMAMAAIGLKTNFIKLIKTGGTAILLGFSCWLSIIITSLLIQHIVGIF